MSRSRGFTLVELLITVAIIGVLSAIGLVVFSTVLKQGRDSKRQADLRSIQSALEQYYSDQGFYPLFSANTNCSALSISHMLRFGCPLKNPFLFNKTYINQIPSDPTANPQYQYTPSPAGCNNVGSKCTSYCLYAHLENSSSPEPAGCTYSGNYNFAVTPP